MGLRATGVQPPLWVSGFPSPCWDLASRDNDRDRVASRCGLLGEGGAGSMLSVPVGDQEQRNAPDLSIVLGAGGAQA